MLCRLLLLRLLPHRLRRRRRPRRRLHCSNILIDWLIDCRWLILKLLWAFHCQSGLLTAFHFSTLSFCLSCSFFFLLFPHTVCVCVVYVCVCRVINAVYFISRQPPQWSKTAAVAMVLFTLGQLNYLPHCALTWCCTWNFSTDNNNKS